MSDYITFDLKSLPVEGIVVRSDLDRLEAAFRCHPAVLAWDLPVIPEDEEFKDEGPRYLLACFNYMENMKSLLLQLAAWIYEDALTAKAEHLGNTRRPLSTPSLLKPSILSTITDGRPTTTCVNHQSIWSMVCYYLRDLA